MTYRNKLKSAPAVLGITVLVVAAAVSTTLALRNHDAADAEAVAGAVASESVPTAADLGVAAQSQGIPEPLFIDGEPVTPFDSRVNVQDLPDGTVSISNPDVEPMPMPAPSPSIAVGEPHPNTPEPRLASPDSVEGQAPIGSTATAGSDFGVNGSDSVSAPEPEEVHVAPNPTIESDVPGS